MKESFHRYLSFKNQYKDFIIIHPIMTGGIVPETVQKKLAEEGWLNAGYSVCFDCLEGRSSFISKPPVRGFLHDVADFFGGDVAEHTFGCRAAQFVVFKAISDYITAEGAKEYDKTVVVDPLCHYTTVMAAEANGFKIVEPPHSGYPEYKVDPQDFIDRIEAVRKSTRKLPGLIVLTHVEPYYGNVNPAKDVGKIAKEYDIPYMVNVAYSGGVMPLRMKDFMADFLTLSAHKSMASLGPLGFLLTSYEWSKKVFRVSTAKPDWSGRTFDKKIVNIFGCSVGGLPLISAMYSFPYVVERIKKWEEEEAKIRWFIKEMEKIEGIMLLGERPHKHHLLHFETPIFWEISKSHKRRGFFLAEEMINRGIVGLHRGLSKHVKLSIYGLSWNEIRAVRDAIYSIVEKYKKNL
jgi:Sep-tRNA:Cys-tRNA synthetase